ncbi:hypothetical protein EZS27_006436 [termite gut metagenome]|uniref:Uncharacterized protein n=1 Tax=termite gut metagenome TaxID=433724 RepID=A0A5J4SKT7_9ZZZZ
MELQNKWKYCEATTCEHNLAIKHPDCIESIHAVIRNEGGKKSFFKTEKCLNLDKIETKQAQEKKQEIKATMDCSFGISHGKQKRMILCEYRLRYKNVNNLSKTELDSKITHSKNLLGTTYVIHNCYLFVFNPEIKKQAIHRLRWLYNGSKNREVIDINKLK